MNLLKNKQVLISLIIVLAVVVFFGLTMIPSVNPTPTNLPIAIVNEDLGVEIPNQGKLNMGNTIVESIQKTSKPTSDEEPAIDWVLVNSYEEVMNGLNNQEYYAALVIPKDFSAKQASLKTPKPSSSEIEILINQGMNSAAANMAGQMLNGVVDNINLNIRTDLLKGFEMQGGTLTTEQAAVLATPITKKVTNVNEVGPNSANGNAPVLLFQPIWLASIAGSVTMFLKIRKLSFSNRTKKLFTLSEQVLVGALLALTAGFGLAWISDAIGMNIPQFTNTALFLSLSFFSFYLMISAVLSWMGMKGISIFIVILYFGAPLLAMAPELMSPFYRQWIYSWLPMRFMIEGLRDLFYFSKELNWNQPTVVLLGIAIVSIIVLLTSALKPATSKKPEAQTA